jgi:hypothetical protein
MVSYPVNQWFDPYMDMGFNPNDCQFITGYGANEIDEKACKLFHSIKEYHRWHYDL